jgi:hypothetical protein
MNIGGMISKEFHVPLMAWNQLEFWELLQAYSVKMPTMTIVD